MPAELKRVARRTVLASSALLVVGGLLGLGSLLWAIRADLRRTTEEMADLRVRTGQQAAEIARLESRLADARALEEAARAELAARLGRESDDAGEVRGQLAALEGRVLALRAAAEQHARALEEAQRDGDVELRLRELMGPSVRVNGRHEVGSGTVLWSGRGGEEAHTYVLTAWHVVREDGKGKAGEGWPLEVDFFRDGVVVRTEPASVLAVEEQLDLALLRVTGREVCETPARLASREELAALRVFSPVVAIGCPLGYPPLPTTGQLTSRDKELDGVHYWMINAPTIFGNSGGGIHASRERMMVGVLSRISAYKNMIDVAVPHMGLVVPMDRVYDWLDGTPWAFTYRDRLARPGLAPGSLPASTPAVPEERR